MRSLPTTTHPKTRGLNCRADLTDPHAAILGIAKVLPRSWATMATNREEVGEEMAVEGTPSAEGVTKTMGVSDDSRSSYYSDGEGDTRHGGRNPRNRPELAPRVAEGDPYDLVGPPAFGIPNLVSLNAPQVSCSKHRKIRR